MKKPPVTEAERRQLTVMFCDLVGSTALAERLDPEELRDLLEKYQGTCAEVISRFDGYIARYVGDALLVYFGYPQAHEDDAQRAVRAALGIVRMIQDLDRKIANPDIGLAVRVGITTGLVVVGDIGRGERVDENAIVGETPNLAARLHALAKPNTVVIGTTTQRLVEGLFDCDDLGAQRVKGISEPVAVYSVRAESRAASRFEAAARRGLSPLVGRSSEVELLLDRWEQAKDGEGQVVFLSGEAGIGKSRIVRGLQERVKEQPHSRVLYYGSPYHQNSAFYPIIDQLERGLRFAGDDSPAQRLEKINAVLGKLNLPVPEHAPVLASLLALSLDDRYPQLDVAPEQLKKKTLQAIIAVLQAMTIQQPVLMVVEDAHWIDPSTLELIGLLIAQLRTARFLLLITFRPEFESPWGRHTHITTLTLNRLSRKESAALIAKMTGGKALPDEVLDQIVTKTDGVPLFIEELTKNVLEAGLLKEAAGRYVLLGPLPELAIPASLQDSLMARLDRLARVKEVAQLAATLGRTFSHELLATVSPLNAQELQNALGQLMHAELIYCRGLTPDVNYEFKHALVQDAAYQSLLKSTRQQYHQRIAQALEKQFPQTAETEPELLAYHYSEARLPEQAIAYWHRAGQRASERSAHLEAIAHLTRGLECIRALPDTPERAKRELSMCITLGPALMATKGWAAQEVGQAYLRARDLCRQVGESSELFAVTWGLWLNHQQRGELKVAQGLADEVLDLAKQQNDAAFLLQAHHAAWTTLFRLADFPASRDHTEQGIALYNIKDHRSHAFLYGGHDPGVCGRVHAAMALWLLGYADQALEQARASLILARQLSHPFSLAQAQGWGAHVYQYRREVESVRELAEATSALSKEYGFAQLSAQGSVLRGWALAAAGQAKEGARAIHEGLMAARATGASARQPTFLAFLAEAYAQTGQVDEGLAALAEALKLIEVTGERTAEAEIYRLRGKLLLHQSAKKQSEAEACYSQALAISRKQSAKSLELRGAISLGRLWCDQGKREEARDLVAPVYEWFTEGFDTADLKEAKALLETLT